MEDVGAYLNGLDCDDWGEDFDRAHKDLSVCQGDCCGAVLPGKRALGYVDRDAIGEAVQNDLHTNWCPRMDRHGSSIGSSAVRLSIHNISLFPRGDT